LPAFWSAKFVGPLGVSLTLLLGAPVLSGILSLLCYVFAAFFGVLTAIGFRQSFTERRHGRDELEGWRNQIEQWVRDRDNPLPHAQADDLRRRMARTRTLEVLRRQDSEGKRDVLLALHNWPLIQRFPYPVIDLEDADFDGANLEGVDLRGASLKRVRLRGANLKGAQLGQGPEDASPMERATRIAKRLAGDFTNSLESCDLRDANMRGANLKNAVLAECKLTGANFERADFREADLRAADLRKARNLTPKQVNKACGSYQQEEVPDTKLPDDLEVPELWRKPIHEQKRERALARLERAHAGP